MNAYREYLLLVMDREGRRSRVVAWCDNMQDAAATTLPPGYRIIKIEEYPDDASQDSPAESRT